MMIDMKVERLRYLAIEHNWWSLFEGNERRVSLKGYGETPEVLFIEQYETWMQVPNEEVKGRLIKAYGEDFFRNWMARDKRTTLDLMSQMDNFYRRLKQDSYITTKEKPVQSKIYTDVLSVENILEQHVIKGFVEGEFSIPKNEIMNWNVGHYIDFEVELSNLLTATSMMNILEYRLIEKTSDGHRFYVKGTVEEIISDWQDRQYDEYQNVLSRRRDIREKLV